jgi:flavin-dependent dehydrogenase
LIRSEAIYDCVIVGGGPAGAACALRLKQLSNGLLHVLLIDKDHFPRHKVCGSCLNQVAVESLQVLGCHNVLHENHAIPLHAWQARYQGTAVGAALPGGFALSRYDLDAAMLDRVRQTNTLVETGTIANFVSQNSESVTLELKSADRAQHSTRQVVTRAAVFATGLSGGALENVLPWVKRPTGPIGAGAIVANTNCEFQSGVIYMACGPSGYAGIVQLPNGQLDVAAALYPHIFQKAKMPLGERVDQILREAGFMSCDSIMDAQWKGTPPLNRSRTLGNGRVIAIGDAAQYIEPFTGEGMAWAMKSGMLAAEEIVNYGANKSPILGQMYKKRYDQALGHRSLPCRIVTRTLHYGVGRRVVFSGLTRAPWLAKPVIEYMNRVS